MRLKHFCLLIVVFLFACKSSPETKDDNYADRMAEEHKDDSPIKNDATTTVIETRAVVSNTVTYFEGEGGKYVGYLAEPTENIQGSVIMIHEWWGLNENVQEMATKLASEGGYRVLAVDFYNGEFAKEPAKAKELMMAAMASPTAGEHNLQKAFDFLRSRGSEKIAIMGWCFGGYWTLQGAIAMGDKIDGAVIYYGKLETDEAKLAKVSVPVLGIFGAEDQGIPVATVDAFKASMDKLQKETDIHVYPDADHAFANPSGTRYKKDAAEDAWAKTLNYLKVRLDGNRAL